jgi:hypothetical protein
MTQGAMDIDFSDFPTLADYDSDIDFYQNDCPTLADYDSDINEDLGEDAYYEAYTNAQIAQMEHLGWSHDDLLSRCNTPRKPRVFLFNGTNTYIGY